MKEISIYALLSTRLSISLPRDVAAYVNEAWRTYRNPQGSSVSSVSGFIEGLIEEYRRNHPIDLE